MRLLLTSTAVLYHVNGYLQRAYCTSENLWQKSLQLRVLFSNDDANNDNDSNDDDDGDNNNNKKKKKKNNNNNNNNNKL